MSGLKTCTSTLMYSEYRSERRSHLVQSFSILNNLVSVHKCAYGIEWKMTFVVFFIFGSLRALNIINWCNLSFRNQQLHLQACWVTVDCWMHADSDTWIMALKEINSKEKYCFKFCIYACADLERGGRSGKSYPPWRIQFLVYVFVSLSYWKFEYWSS